MKRHVGLVVMLAFAASTAWAVSGPRDPQPAPGGQATRVGATNPMGDTGAPGQTGAAGPQGATGHQGPPGPKDTSAGRKADEATQVAEAAAKVAAYVRANALNGDPINQSQVVDLLVSYGFDTKQGVVEEVMSQLRAQGVIPVVKPSAVPVVPGGTKMVITPGWLAFGGLLLVAACVALYFIGANTRPIQAVALALGQAANRRQSNTGEEMTFFAAGPLVSLRVTPTEGNIAAANQPALAQAAGQLGIAQANAQAAVGVAQAQAAALIGIAQAGPGAAAPAQAGLPMPMITAAPIVLVPQGTGAAAAAPAAAPQIGAINFNPTPPATAPAKPAATAKPAAGTTGGNKGGSGQGTGSNP